MREAASVTDYLTTWRALESAADQPAAVAGHLSFPAQTGEDRAVLDRLVARLVRVEAADERLGLVFSYARYDDEECLVECGAPYDGPAGSVPPSTLGVARVHNGLNWDYLGGGGMGFLGVEEGSVCEGGWEADALADAAEDNAEFLGRLRTAGLSVDDVESPMDYGQNWFIWDPTQTNALDEPVLYFVSHGDCVAVPVDSARDLAFGPLLLRVMAQDILDERTLKEAYS